MSRGTYRLSRRSRRWLDPASPLSVAGFVESTHDYWSWWADLDRVVRDGAPVAHHDKPADHPYWDRYIRGQLDLARLSAGEVARKLPVPTQAGAVLDLGGGHGWYAAQLCRRFPRLRATVLDLPGSAAVGRRIMADAGLSQRVQHRDGDVTQDELGGPYDVVLCFNVVHHLTPEQIVQLFGRVRSSLAPGGVFAVMDAFAEPRRRGSAAAELPRPVRLPVVRLAGAHPDRAARMAAAGRLRRAAQDAHRPHPRPGALRLESHLRVANGDHAAGARTVGGMDFRYLGNSGLQISEITYGNWLTHGSQVENDVATQCVRAALDDGITTFDTADVYANGKAETVLGEALKGERRESLEIFTKVYWPTGPDPKGKNDAGLSRKHILESIDGSLRRLQTDYVDLYQAHRYDTFTPLEETMQAFADVVRAGKALYIGVSEWTADQIRAGHALAQRARRLAGLAASRSTRCCGASSRTRSCRPARNSASARSSGRRSRRAC